MVENSFKYFIKDAAVIRENSKMQTQIRWNCAQHKTN